MTKIVIHPGFHKTGTTFVQSFFQENQSKLEPFVSPIFNLSIKQVPHAARVFSIVKDQASLDVFRDTLRARLAAIPCPNTDIFLSAEALCGQIPGRNDVQNYNAIFDLLPVTIDIVKRAFPQVSDIQVAFTTRDHLSWAKSAYWQTIRATKSTDSFDEYLDRIKAMGSLTALVDQVSKVIDDVPIVNFPLDSQKTKPFGPATPFLDIFGVTPSVRRELRAVPIPNSGGDEQTIAKILDINRSALPDDQKLLQKALIVAKPHVAKT